LFDHFGASKRLMVIGILGMVLIILIRLTLEILYKIFSLSLEVFKKSDDNYFTINLERFNSPTPRYYAAIGLIAWLYMFINFFYILQLIAQPIKDFFTTDRSIGSFVFTFEGILLFVSIIFISTLVSKMLSYLLADSKVLKDRTKGKKGIELGSWVLLLRIGIISIGLLIAFASAGIPLDRITIIISALSVGIGFGMQTLINNLVSGIIIAFEKPVNVGDVVEVAGKTGRMKSIGVRSSMVTTWDGSDVVIPNGDLLNQHLTNWTLGNSYARFAIIVGVAYGTNLEEAHKFVVDLLQSRDDVLKYPQPLITFTEFGSSSIDLAIKFWVADYSTGVTVKSDLIIAIDKLFKEKNISIPFPQQDVYIKSLPDKAEGK
jgi:potassium efflux system protein